MKLAITKVLLAAILVLSGLSVNAQVPTQTIRGTVLDKDSQIPLIGATIQIMDVDGTPGEIKDIDGRFRMECVPKSYDLTF